MHCVLFANIESSRNAAKLGQVYSSTFNTWSKALKKVSGPCQDITNASNIDASGYSFSAMHATKNFAYQCANQHALVTKNRAKLRPIVEAVILCGRQNISLRGHRDDSTHYHNDKNNPGNLQEILEFIVKCGNNSDFEEHIASAPKNATYRSKTTQNQIIKICGEEIVAELCREIKAAKLFSVLADEAAHVSNVDQMPLVLRFVDSESRIRE